MTTGDEQAAALRKAALEMAIDYHDRAAQHPTSHGPRSARAITVTADEFYLWLREVGQRAGVSADDVDANTR